MSGPQQDINIRKHKRAEQHPLPLNEGSQPLSKRQRRHVHHSTGFCQPPAYWDSLSKIWLTEDALRELDRRNTHSSPNPAHTFHRPITRNFLAKLKLLFGAIVSASDFPRNCTPRILKDIRRFARHGGPDLSDMRGHLEPIHPPVTIKKSAPKNRNYEQKLIDDGTFPYGYKYPDGQMPPLPNNWEELNRGLVRPWPRLSPSTILEEQYEEFRQADARAFNEDAVKNSVIPILFRAIGSPGGAQKNVLFNKITPLTDSITQAKPDYYFGAPPEQIHPKVREDLSSHIIASSSTKLPAVPNMYMEAKGPGGSFQEALLQVCHYGMIGARAMQSISSYGQTKPVYSNNVHTISSIYHAGHLKIYGHSVAQPGGYGTQPEYYMHQLAGFSMTSNLDVFIQGATAFKRAIDWTAQRRNAAIARANEMVRQAIEDEEDDEEDDEEE